MKYRGFNEVPLLAAQKDLEDIHLSLPQIYPIINLAGMEWRSNQVLGKRHDEILDIWDSAFFQTATFAFMDMAMKENRKLAKLGHTKEFDRFMLLAMDLAFNILSTSDSSVAVNWLIDGDSEKRKIILAFAMGSFVLVDSDAIDLMIDPIIHGRYESSEIASYVIEVIHKLRNAGYACLNPVAGAAPIEKDDA
ncbi:MAG: hypothetical protein WCL50_01210 [Spirochaetota bacterium]